MFHSTNIYPLMKAINSMSKDEIMAVSNTFNPTIAVNTTTDVITINGHGYLQNQSVLYSNGGGGATSIGGLVNGYKYYVIFLSSNTFKLATTEDTARTATAIDLLSVGTGSTHSLAVTFQFPNEPAYVDVFRKFRFFGTGLPVTGATLEAKSVRDTVNIISGGNLVINNINQDTGSVTIDAPAYALSVPTGTVDLNLSSNSGYSQSVTLTPVRGIAITRGGPQEVKFESFGVTETDNLQSVTQRGNITSNNIYVNNLTVASIKSSDGGLTGISITSGDNVTGTGTVGNPLQLAPDETVSTAASKTITISFSATSQGMLDYTAVYKTNLGLSAGSVIIQRQDPSTLVWGTFDSASGTSATNSYQISNVYAEAYNGTVNYRITISFSGNTGSVNYRIRVTFDPTPVTGVTMIKSDTTNQILNLGSSGGRTNVYGPSYFYDNVYTTGMSIYQNEIVGLNSNDDIIIDPNGTGNVRIKAPGITTDQTTFNLINSTPTTVNFAGAATALYVGANTGTLTLKNITITAPNATTLNINGASPTVATTSTGTASVFNTNALTGNLFGDATTVTIGASSASTMNLRSETMNMPNATSLNINGASPSITTTSTGTVNIFNANALTGNLFGAATTITIGATTGTLNLRPVTITAANATTFNINGASPSIVTSDTGTASVFNTNALTGNLFGAATTVTIGATTGTLNLRNATITAANATTVNLSAATTINMNGANPSIITTDTGTAAVFNTNALTGNLFGAATTVTIGATSGTLNLRPVTITAANATAFNMNGASPTVATTSTGTASVFNTNALTGNLFGAATTVSIGAGTGTTTVNNALTATGTLTASAAVTATGNNVNVTLSPTGTGSVTIAPDNGVTIAGATTLTLGTVGQTTTMRGNISAVTNDQTITLSPALTGTVTINPNTAGTINNMSIGATTRKTGAFTTGLVGAAAAFTNWPNTTFVATQSLTGHSHTNNAGITGEAVADSADTTKWGVGVYGRGNTNVGTRSAGVLGDGGVTNSTDTASAIGVRGYADDTHASGLNIGLYSSATNSAIGNYALYMNAGNIYSVAAQTWTVLDNNTSALSIDSATKAGILLVKTSTGSQGVTMSGTLSVTGHLTVEGVTSTGATGTGKFVFDGTPTISTPSMSGGTHTAITTLGIRDTSAAFDVNLAATSSTIISAGRTLTFDVVNADRTIKLGGNISLGGAITTANSLTTTGNFTLSIATTAATSVTLPTSGTLYGTASGSITSSQLATSMSDETGTGALVFGTNPSLTAPTWGNTANTTDADFTLDAGSYGYASWIVNFTANRSINVTNLAVGRRAVIYVRNTNGSSRSITVNASATTTGLAAVNMAVGAGAASSTTVSLAATSGTAVIYVWNTGTLVGMVN
jgi:hypothetical protein